MADFEFGSSYVFNPKSIGSGVKPNIVKANAGDYYLWDKDNSYLPATSNHEYFNVVDFCVDNSYLSLEDGLIHFLTSNNAKISLFTQEKEIFTTSAAKFGKTLIEKLPIEVNSLILDCPIVEKIEYSPSAINDISQYAYLAYKSIKRGSDDWYKYVNDAWARERTEYLYKGKLILADNKIAELVSTTALCVRPDGDKLVIINK